MSRRGVTAVLLGLSSGCVSMEVPEAPAPDPAPEPVPVDPSRHLCDGRDGPQLAIAQRGGMPFPGDDGSPHSYLIIDGQCRFWISNPEGRGRLGGAGVLPPVLRDRVEHALNYQSLNALGGEWCSVPEDVSTLSVSDPTASVDCTGDLVPDTPVEIDEIFIAIDGVRSLVWTESLWRGSQSEPLRIAFRPVAAGAETPPPVPWPFAADPLAAPELIEDPAEARELRGLVNEYHAKHDGAGPFVTGPDGTVYELFARDRLPFENERGVLTMPWW